MKLEKGTFKNIKYNEISKIFKDNKNIPFFKDYFKTKVQEALDKWNKESLKLKDFNSIKNNLKKWSVNIDSYIYDFLIWPNKDVLNTVIWLCKSYSDLEKVLFNKRLWYVLTNLEASRFKSVFNLLKIDNFDDFISFFNNPRIIQLLFSDCNLKEFEEIKDFRNFFISNTYEFYKLSKLSLPDCLFNEKSHWSNVLSQITLEMRKNQNKWLLNIMDDLVEKEFIQLTQWLEKYDNKTRSDNWKRINKFQLFNMPLKYKKLIEKLQIDTDKHELAIYIRYWNTVDFPEIAESIVIFLKKYINKGFSRYFSSIRILPVEADKTISKELFDEKTRYYPVYGDEFKTLHICASSLYLSHSSVINPWNTPWIISNRSKSRDEFNIKTKLELEQDKSEDWFEEKQSLNSVLTEILHNIQALEYKLDKIWYLDKYNLILILKKIKKDVKNNIKKIIY